MVRESQRCRLDTRGEGREGKGTAAGGDAQGEGGRGGCNGEGSRPTRPGSQQRQSRAAWHGQNEARRSEQGIEGGFRRW